VSGDDVAAPTADDAFWHPGQQIRWTYRRPDWQPSEAQTVHPMTVVRDDETGLVAWLAGDTPVLLPRLADGTSLRTGPARTQFTAPRIQGRGIWHGNGTLRIAPAGKPWSVWLFRDTEGAFADYYEQPHRRDGRTTISSDHVLDIVVHSDHRYYRKDEDELAEAVRQGRYTPEKAASIERDADDVEAVIAAWGSPFCDGWESWQPDPAWPVPPLPDDIAFQVDLID